MNLLVSGKNSTTVISNPHEIDDERAYESFRTWLEAIPDVELQQNYEDHENLLVRTVAWIETFKAELDRRSG